MKLCPLHNIKVVIIGQDPYPTPGMANGLAFSVSPHTRGKFPPTLRNIFKELRNDLNDQLYWPKNGDLSAWARQGVLLLNTHLTVAPSEPMSHRHLGWTVLTSEIIDAIIDYHFSKTVFVFWGKEAQEFVPNIGASPRVISSHPSPLSAHASERPFLGSKPFSRINALLTISKEEPIVWRIE